MAITLQALVAALSPVVTQLEGPYKWYVMAGVAVILTALITRYIFKTFKWFLLLVLVVALLAGGFSFLLYLSTTA